jgi:nicotinamide mononucleotide transporter
MADLFASIVDYLTTLPWLELVAMLLALAYVILAAQGSLWCWPAAFISTALYTVIFYDVLLLMDSALNAYYLVMAVYGYWAWQKNTSTDFGQNQPQKTVPLAIISWSAHWHGKAAGV